MELTPDEVKMLGHALEMYDSWYESQEDEGNLSEEEKTRRALVISAWEKITKS